MFVKDNLAVVVTEFADTYEVMLEGGHDFGIADRELGETDVGLCC